MVAHIKDNPGCYIAAEVGLGKTATTLEAIKTLPHPVLIVAPLRVAKHVWEAEAIKWGYDYTFSYILGHARKREQALQATADIYIINVENLVWLRNKFKVWPFKTLVLDEASLFKSPGAKRTRAAQWIGSRCDNTILLSGTPAAASLLDLYAQMKVIDGGKRLGRSMAAYKHKYFYPTDWQRYNWEVKPGCDDLIHEAVSDVMISLSAEDYLTLPKLIVNDVKVDMGTVAMRNYKELVKAMYLQIEDSEIDAVSAGVLVNKLVQCTSGAVYDEHKDVLHLHDAKMNALDDIIVESAGQPILIVYQYRHTLNRIMASHPRLRLSDDSGIADWNAGKVELLALHNSTSHGLNLQSAGHIMVFVDIPWSAEAYIQMVGRLHRQNQTKPVIVHRLICEGTIDEDICDSLENKMTTQQLLMRAVK